MNRAGRRALAGLLGRPSAPANIAAWLPPAADVPAAIYDGFIDAIETVYGFPAARPPGFADFEAHFGADGDPLTEQRLRSAHSYLVQQTVTATWSWPLWWLVLSPALLAVPMSLLIGRSLPNAQHFFSETGEPGERGAYEIVTLGMGLGNIAPFMWSMYLWSQVPDRTGTFVNALVMGILRSVLTIAGLATHHIDDLSAGVRWGAIFAPQLAVDLYALVRGIIHTVEDRPDLAFVHFINTFPTMSGLTTLLFAELMKLIGLDTDTGFWITWVILTLAFILIPGILIATWLADNGGIASLFAPEGRLPIGDVLSAFNTANPAGLAHLFDDSTLWRSDRDAAPTLDQLRYPSGTRGLVKMWWPGAGTLQVAHDDHTIRLQLDDADPIVVHLSFSDLTAAALAERLVDDDGLAGLEVRVVDEDNGGLRLPYPTTVDDPGDAAGTIAEHDRHAGDFVGVGTTEDDAYVIAHTPRATLTTRFGVRGPATTPLDGFPLVPGPTLGDLDISAVGMAGDLAALMCMGLAPTISAAPIAPNPAAPPVPNPNATEVYQVFRRWNLDERRVNEWKMLIHGGAESDKAGHPIDHDVGMRDHPNAAGYVSPASGGEALANQMGWLPTWRAWLRVAADPAGDTALDTADAATPFVPTGDASTTRPTNAELSEAVRFLLDLQT